jgi:arylsulfatase A-like enzyme
MMEKKTLTRRSFLAMSAAAAALPAFARAAAGDKPNVLFIAVDDLRPQLNCYGKKQIVSPNIDRLAREGLLFERTYCQQAVCAPSRASILTGLRPDSTRIYDLNTPVRKALPDVLTLPQHFRNNGYETLSIGKIYHHPNDDKPGWTIPPFRAGTFPAGDWKGRGYRTQEAIEQMNRYLAENPGSDGRGPAYECAAIPDNQYPDGANAEHAIEELRRLKAAGRPFFMAMGFYKPHLPFNAPKKYWDLYRREDIKLADNPFLPADCPSYAPSNWGELRNYVGIPKDGPLSDDLARTLIHAYFACVSYTDAQIGRLLDELDRLDLRRNTVVILWGDHGWKLGEHSMWCKHTNFELDTHVPMIVSAPNRKRSIRTRALTEFVDIYPSLCDLAGLTVPAHCEGTSFAPLLDKPDRPWKAAAFSQYPRGKVMGYTMRTDRYRYTEWQDRKTGEALARELYDHDVDPSENKNIAAEEDMKKTVAELAAKLKAGWQAARPSV